MKNLKEFDLQDAISSYKSAWRERFELQEQIDMEKGLNEQLQKSHFSESEFDFSYDISTLSNDKQQYQFGKSQNQINDLNFRVPLLKQIKDLEINLQELKAQCCSEHEESQMENSKSKVDYLKEQIQSINEDIKSLDLCINNLLDKIVSFEDDELHELRTRKQHYDLLKKSNQKLHI